MFQADDHCYEKQASSCSQRRRIAAKINVEPNASRVMTLNSSILVFPARCSAFGCCCARSLDHSEARLSIEQWPGFTDFLGSADFCNRSSRSDSKRWARVPSEGLWMTSPCQATPVARLYAGRLSLRSSALYRGSVASDGTPGMLPAASADPLHSVFEPPVWSRSCLALRMREAAALRNGLGDGGSSRPRASSGI